MSTVLETFKDLRNLFPNESLDNLKRAASYYFTNSASFTSLLTHAPETHQLQLPQFAFNIATNPFLENYLHSQFQTLQELLPDGEDWYLRDLFEQYVGYPAMEETVLRAITSQEYPKKQVQKKEIVQFDVKRYCDLVPNPLGSYSHRNYIMTDKMKKEATDYLVKVFGQERRSEISRCVSDKESLYLAYKSLREGSDEGNAQFCTEIKTAQQQTFDETPDYLQTFEKLFIENEGVILSFLDKQKRDENAKFQLDKQSGKLSECQICYGSSLQSKMFKICANDHAMCGNCVKQRTELLFHSESLIFPCVYENCDYLIPNHVIRSVWDTSLYSKLLAERIAQSTADQLVCPFCNNVNKKSKGQEINCTNCRRNFCILCNKVAHAPLRCNQKENDICKAVEESMTKELVRTCPGCQRSFIKEPGCCNRVRCPKCNTYICYLCRKIVSGANYKHFYGPGVLPSEAQGLCPLNSDINNIHVRSVIDSGRKALEKAKKENPDVHLAYNPLDVLPNEGASDAVYGQY